jgi:hypothetical protein
MNLTLPSTLVSAAVAWVIAIADAPPKFDAAPGCKAAAAINQSLDLSVSQDYESCMNDEESARSELVQNWSTYPADAKTRCVGQTTVGGTPSYVEVVECIIVTVNVSNDSATPTQDTKPPRQDTKKKNQKTRQ